MERTIASLPDSVSVLYREPKLLKGEDDKGLAGKLTVSVLYREPKLLKAGIQRCPDPLVRAFQCSTVSRNC